MKTWKKILFVLPWLIIIIFAALSPQMIEKLDRKEWTGFLYSDSENIQDESTWRIQPGFKNIEDCRDWIFSKSNYGFDYECGYNCRYDLFIDMNVCEETKK